MYTHSLIEFEFQWCGMEWKHPTLPIKNKFKSQPSAGKVMFTLFWDSQGPILEHLQEGGTTVNGARY